MDFAYDLTIDPDAENNTHAFALGMIGHNKSVLEVGCATGYFTKVLAERGCKVVGMELDPDAGKAAETWAERVAIGNVQDPGLWEQVDDESFDVVTFGDVLEHLQDPLAVLQVAVHKLKPSGFIVTSLPNIAHGDVRLSLLHGSFQYRELGLLDRTHMRFFTLQTIRELLRDAGLVIVETERVVMPLFNSELGVKQEDYPEAVVDEIRTDPEFETYQYVMKSVVDNGSQAVLAMSAQLDELSDLRQKLESQVRLLQAQTVGDSEMRGQHAELLQEAKTLRDHIEELTRQVHQLHTELGEMTARAEQQAATMEEQAATMEEQAATMEEQAATMEKQAEAVRSVTAALAESERQYSAIRNSRSFRLTAPLRRLQALSRGHRTT